MSEITINYVAHIEGRSAEMIIDKIAEFKKTKNVKLSNSRATQLLLCELYNIKQGVKDKCD